MESSRIFSVARIKTSQKPTKATNSEILRIANKRKPFSPADFVEDHFIPKLKKKSMSTTMAMH